MAWPEYPFFKGQGVVSLGRRAPRSVNLKRGANNVTFIQSACHFAIASPGVYGLLAGACGG